MSRQEAAKILNVPENASQALIKKAYLQKALRAHPDVPGGSNEAMREIIQANAILSGKADEQRQENKSSKQNDKESHNAEVDAWLRRIKLLAWHYNNW